MNNDITEILEGWDYRPDKPAVREITGEDGRQKIQLRLDLGLLQMETTGRPDGKRPHGKETLLEHYRDLIRNHGEHADGDSAFQLAEEDCVKLQMESMQFYHRRISWLELGEYQAAERDAEHNLEIIELVGTFGQTEQLREMFLQWKPFVIVHRTMAKARLAWETGDYDRAIELIEEGVGEIGAAYREQGREDAAEHAGEVAYLRKWAEEIDETRPLTLEQRIERELNEAVETESFERAAELRDRLLKIRSEGASSGSDE